jgi:phenylalanyl-tRNA synthetase beta chain
LLTVDVGQAEPLSIVCGAQNVTVGMKAPCALVGAKLPSIEIKQAKVRGIASFGMMCSEKELGLAEESAGLMVLAADAVVGRSIREHLDLDDQLITLKLSIERLPVAERHRARSSGIDGRGSKPFRKLLSNILAAIAARSR